MTDEETGRKRQAFADELTQPQELFLFYAEEERRKKRNGEDENKLSGAETPGGKTTHHIA